MDEAAWRRNSCSSFTVRSIASRASWPNFSAASSSEPAPISNSMAVRRRRRQDLRLADVHTVRDWSLLTVLADRRQPTDGADAPVGEDLFEVQRFGSTLMSLVVSDLVAMPNFTAELPASPPDGR